MIKIERETEREREIGEKRGLLLTLEGQMPISNVQGLLVLGKNQHFAHIIGKIGFRMLSLGAGVDNEHGFCMVLKCFSTDYLFVAKEKLVVILYSTG